METFLPLSQIFWFGGMLFLLGIMPGIGVVNVIHFTLARGWGGGVVASLGTLSADLIYILLATLGSSLTINFFSHYGEEIRLMGGVVLLFFALEKFIRPPQLRDNLPPVTGDRVKIFLFSLGLSLSNPKVFIFYVAFLPGFFDLNRIGLGDIFIILIVACTGLGAAFVIVVGLAQILSQRILSPARIRYLNGLVGMVLLFFAISIIASWFNKI